MGTSSGRYIKMSSGRHISMFKGRESPQDIAWDVPWRYIEDHMGTSIGRILGASSGRPRDVILPSGMHMKRVFKLPLLEFT